LQSGWHEYHLRTAQRLTLNTDRGAEIVQLQGRRVERLAIALMDYGSFQDRVVVGQILAGHLAANFGTTHEKFVDKIAEVNQKVTALRDLNEKLFRLDGSPSPWQPFFNCWFLSVPQFLMMLDAYSGVEPFFKELRRTRHLSLSSRDFYFEYAYAKRLAQSAKQGAN
jgi:D-Tyr-tRNAtyr deacylase